MKKKLKKVALTLDISDSTEDRSKLDTSVNNLNSKNVLSYTSMEIGLKSVIFKNENLVISSEGMKNAVTGEKITSLIDPSDLELGECIGNGASGSVHLATYKPKNIIIAVKSINIYDEGKRKQLKNDLSVLNENKCPFLVHFYGAFFEEGKVKILLEYMNIGSLDKLIQNIKTKNLQNCCKVPEVILSKIVIQILQGLLYLHKVKHQIHRDIKPANILINKYGMVKLTDFGIARTFENTSDFSTTFVGSKNFMSPERVVGKEYSFSSDIWSLGLIIYELCTGTFPYCEGNDFLAQITKIINEPVPSLIGNNCFSVELQDFVSRCLKKDPNERDSAIELLNHPWIITNSGGEGEVYEWLAELFGYEL